MMNLFFLGGYYKGLLNYNQSKFSTDVIFARYALWSPFYLILFLICNIVFWLNNFIFYTTGQDYLYNLFITVDNANNVLGFSLALGSFALIWPCLWMMFIYRRKYVGLVVAKKAQLKRASRHANILYTAVVFLALLAGYFYASLRGVSWSF
ncbi:hypothetical protein DFR28_1021124 [Arenicella xantha]|uniref:Uncharacterized protein n=1 Tax=Arenicella xantha TaxID=644221 RepID=A0A395JLQ0_9GAMM|nr:hypothetical protein DFR28_1021124 [Arenicella xantha]